MLLKAALAGLGLRPGSRSPPGPWSGSPSWLALPSPERMVWPQAGANLDYTRGFPKTPETRLSPRELPDSPETFPVSLFFCLRTLPTNAEH